MTHATFVTIARGLNRTSGVMRLFEKAKRLGIWNPSDLDFHQDQLDWQNFSDQERLVILHLVSMFQAGEEAVTVDLLPLIQVIASEGRLEEEMFLTTFLWEEAKHVDFFRRFLDEVAGSPEDLGRFASASYKSIVYEELPSAMEALRMDHSPAAQLRASIVYNMIVEGVLAETGYHAFFTILERNNKMPGVRKGIALLKQDESRHIAYGIYLISRIIQADPSLWARLEETMNALLTPAVQVIGEIFANYEVMPFGLQEDEFIQYAIGQFSRRFERIEKARSGFVEFED